MCMVRGNLGISGSPPLLSWNLFPSTIILYNQIYVSISHSSSHTHIPLSSDVNDDCCSGCQYANSSNVCREYAPGNIQCLENIHCMGTSKKCPVNELSYVPIESACPVDGKCYPPDSVCSRYDYWSLCIK